MVLAECGLVPFFWGSVVPFFVRHSGFAVVIRAPFACFDGYDWLKRGPGEERESARVCEGQGEKRSCLEGLKAYKSGKVKFTSFGGPSSFFC